MIPNFTIARDFGGGKRFFNHELLSKGQANSGEMRAKRYVVGTLGSGGGRRGNGKGHYRDQRALNEDEWRREVGIFRLGPEAEANTVMWMRQTDKLHL